MTNKEPLSDVASAWEESGDYLTIDGHRVFFHDVGEGPMKLPGRSCCQWVDQKPHDIFDVEPPIAAGFARGLGRDRRQTIFGGKKFQCKPQQ